MGQFNLDNYEPVQDRLPKFFAKYPDGRIITNLEHHSADFAFVVFRATLYAGAADTPLATGWAYEKAGDGYVNKTSHIENCETSAIGRALANIGLHGNLRPSREEMQKVDRMTKPELPAMSDDVKAKLRDGGCKTVADVKKVLAAFDGDVVAMEKAGEFFSWDTSEMIKAQEASA